jgi:hypothetical protein
MLVLHIEQDDYAARVTADSHSQLFMTDRFIMGRARGPEYVGLDLADATAVAEAWVYAHEQV